MASLTEVVNVGNTIIKSLSALVDAINNKFPNWVDVPPTASSPGTPGQVAYDATHIYVCTATNTWVRATLSTF